MITDYNSGACLGNARLIQHSKINQYNSLYQRTKEEKAN